jgi:hypothetical protein
MCVLSPILLNIAKAEGNITFNHRHGTEILQKFSLIWAERSHFHGAKFLFIYYVCHFIVLSAL